MTEKENRAQQRNTPEQKAFLQEKVTAARESIKAGRGVSNEEVEAASISRRQLLDRKGGR